MSKPNENDKDGMVECMGCGEWVEEEETYMIMCQNCRDKVLN